MHDEFDYTAAQVARHAHYASVGFGFSAGTFAAAALEAWAQKDVDATALCSISASAITGMALACYQTCKISRLSPGEVQLDYLIDLKKTLRANRILRSFVMGTALPCVLKISGGTSDPVTIEDFILPAIGMAVISAGSLSKRFGAHLLQK